MSKNGLVRACITLTVAGLVLVGCGSNASNSSDRSRSDGVDRNAGSGGSNFAQICMGDRPGDRVAGATVTYRRGTDVFVDGPFPLEGNECYVGSYYHLAGTVLLPDGTPLGGFRTIPIGMMVAVSCGDGIDGKSYYYDMYVKVGVPIDNTCGSWKIAFVRNPNTRSAAGGDQLNYQVWVSTA